jgi:hypothetical protein
MFNTLKKKIKVVWFFVDTIRRRNPNPTKGGMYQADLIRVKKTDHQKNRPRMVGKTKKNQGGFNYGTSH